MRFVFTEPDDVRGRFEAACFRIGEGSARQAFSLALNKEGRKAYTAHRRALAEQSSIPRGAVTATMKFKASTRATLETRIIGTGRHLPLSVFGARQFSYGVRPRSGDGRRPTDRPSSSVASATMSSSGPARRAFQSSSSGDRPCRSRCCATRPWRPGKRNMEKCCRRHNV